MYVTDSGRGDSTAHSNKIVNISHLEQLLLQLLDSSNFKKPQFVTAFKRGMVNDWQWQPSFEAKLDMCYFFW